MYIKRRYSFGLTFNWSKWPFILGVLYAFAVYFVACFTTVNIAIPWQAISVIGIAVAFYLGFKNNSSYDRTWEARKIWGGIVNSSRTFGVATVAFIQGEKENEIKKELLYRHIGWLIALRSQLRLSRTWEHEEKRLHEMYCATVCETYNNKLESEISQFVSKEELQLLEGKSNIAAQLLMIQSKRLQELKDLGYFNDFKHTEFHRVISSLYDEQGRAERIKNFPFPRQYASTAVWLTFVFSFFVPFSMLDIFKEPTTWVYWVSPFISGLIIWVFFLMEKIGDYSENPFEGTHNDVPITSIARGIEIDLREMINDQNIPQPVKDIHGFLM